MSVFKSKHVVIAMLVAPVLAILSYFTLDVLVGEKPKPAMEGQSYPLAEKPNCRYGSGSCGLKNADFELELSIRELGADRVELTVNSVLPLDGVMVSMVEGDLDSEPPVAMQARSEDGKNWSLAMMRPDAERHRLRLVASAKGSLYYGDAATKFTVHGSAADSSY
jgi:hypothetical protein